jgi:hypothetical protein
VHEGDDVPVMGKETKTPTCEGKKAPQFSKAEHQSQLQALMEKRIAEIQSQVDKKFASFSQYVDRHLASIESKLEALAEASHRHENDFNDIVQEGYFDKKIDEKFDLFMKVAADRFDEQIDEKLTETRSLVAAVVEKISTKIGQKNENPSSDVT